MSVKLANRELLTTLGVSDSDELVSALTWALDTTSRAWSMTRDGWVQALAC